MKPQSGEAYFLNKPSGCGFPLSGTTMNDINHRLWLV